MEKRVRSLQAGLLLSALFLSGCYQDRDQAYKRFNPEEKPSLEAVQGAAASKNPPPGAAKEKPLVEEKPVVASTAKAPSALLPTAEEMGLPFYPGAEPEERLNESLRLAQSVDNKAIVLVTDAPPERVEKFYLTQMPKLKRSPDAGNDANSRTLEYFSAADGGKTVEIRARDGKTQIELTSIKVSLKPDAGSGP